MRRGIMLTQEPMNKRSIIVNKRGMIAVAVSMILIGAPLLVHAAQIMPNPNPTGST